jgi:malate dehydrogenase (oxaloacetate-decarboxylating)
MGVMSEPGLGGKAKRWESRVDSRTGERYLAVALKGAALKEDAILNKGTCFTPEERDELGLRGILPPAVATQAEQEMRSYENYLKGGDEVGRYLFLAALQDRNETLFYRLLVDHLEEMVPIVYTPTVGKVCEKYSHIYRRPRGLYVSTQDRGHIKDVLRNAECDERPVIVVTDNEAILGIGDQGVGGMGIAIGKLALYSAGAGIHPWSTLPLDLDVGTDNPALLQDPLYLGVRHARLRGEAYISLVDELVEGIREVFPGALVQWEDFSNRTAFQVLNRYRRKLPSFDDDIQGTGAVVAAGIRSGCMLAGRKLQDERIVFYGAGASGAGCAYALRSAMRSAGVKEDELARRVLVLDSQGLILRDRPGLDGHKLDIAADPAVVAGWRSERAGRFSLADVVRGFQPTTLVGVSGQPSSFTEDIVRTMFASCPRPIVLCLSNPTNKTEARPEDLLRWTNGAAIVGTGSPFPPVTLNGVTYAIGQGNNALIFPGFGLGAMAVEARWLPESAFDAAAQALFEYAAPGIREGAPIFPPLSRLREVSRVVAKAVGLALVEAEAAPMLTPEQIEQRIEAIRWEPNYVRYRAEPISG